MGLDEEKTMPNSKWTTNNIPDLSGKVVIVTGANAGLGFGASKELARKGAVESCKVVPVVH
jgi:NADP-dependent 3-hydroxy acid dehydrogenase YdfG